MTFVISIGKMMSDDFKTQLLNDIKNNVDNISSKIPINKKNYILTALEVIEEQVAVGEHIEIEQNKILVIKELIKELNEKSVI